MMMNVKEKLEKTLKDTFHTEQIQIVDDSASHAGHKEAVQSGGGHFFVTIISDDFRNKSPIERHRMVYECLKKEFEKEIHALSVKTYTPEEASSRS